MRLHDDEASWRRRIQLLDRRFSEWARSKLSSSSAIGCPQHLAPLSKAVRAAGNLMPRALQRRLRRQYAAPIVVQQLLSRANCRAAGHHRYQGERSR